MPNFPTNLKNRLVQWCCNTQTVEDTPVAADPAAGIPPAGTSPPSDAQPGGGPARRKRKAGEPASSLAKRNATLQDGSESHLPTGAPGRQAGPSTSGPSTITIKVPRRPGRKPALLPLQPLSQGVHKPQLPLPAGMSSSSPSRPPKATQPVSRTMAHAMSSNASASPAAGTAPRPRAPAVAERLSLLDYQFLQGLTDKQLNLAREVYEDLRVYRGTTKRRADAARAGGMKPNGQPSASFELARRKGAFSHLTGPQVAQLRANVGQHYYVTKVKDGGELPVPPDAPSDEEQLGAVQYALLAVQAEQQLLGTDDDPALLRLLARTAPPWHRGRPAQGTGPAGARRIDLG